jgi:hypothetical protein
MKVICKHCGLNYFGLGYWRGIVCAQNYTMHVQYFSYTINVANFPYLHLHILTNLHWYINELLSFMMLKTSLNYI